MLTHTVLGAVAVAVMAAVWVVVQLSWAKAFPEGADEPDVLARRGGCGACAGRPGHCRQQGSCQENPSNEEHRK